MLEDDQKLRLITAAVKMQYIIATLEMDQEFRILKDAYYRGNKSLQDDAQTLEHDNAQLRVAGKDILPSQSSSPETLYSKLNKTICNLSRLVDQINNLPLH